LEKWSRESLGFSMQNFMVDSAGNSRLVYNRNKDSKDCAYKVSHENKRIGLETICAIC
jgi:hypothetical protein